MRKNSLDHSNSTEEIRVEFSIDLFFGAFFDCAAQAVAGVVDENVDLAELFNRFFYSGIDGVFLVTSNRRHKAV